MNKLVIASAARLASRGYQKTTPRDVQLISSVFSVLHTLFVEYEELEGQEYAGIDQLYFRRMIDEKTIINHL